MNSNQHHGEKLLLVEDCAEVRQLVQAACEALGYQVDTEVDGAAGLRRALSDQYSLILLDIGLPSLDGLQICKSLREKSFAPHILFISSYADDSNKYIGLESGADDFISKPFSIRELVARINRLNRRRAIDAAQRGSSPAIVRESAAEVYRYLNLEIDCNARLVRFNGEEVAFAPLEYEVLAYLVKNSNRVVPREELLEAVWQVRSATFFNTLSSHISRVRTKIERSADQQPYILTVRGFGYQFAARERLHPSH